VSDMDNVGVVTITTAVENIGTLISNVMTTIVGNELLMTLFCGSLFFLGCSAVKAIKKTAKK